MALLKRHALSVGNTILNGKYEVLKVIHVAGMANVYLVSDENLNKQWCLKEIKKSEAGKNDIEVRSLIHEAKVIKSLNHSSIPRIVTIEEDGDSTFIVMDYVEGVSIKEWITRKGVISQKDTVDWIKQVCSVLMYLHNRKEPIFYRDMKPDNIMVQEDGSIKVVDFGISEIITDNNKYIKEPLGTKGFAAPEQRYRGKPYDLRSDIYSLGATMYCMLTGLSPSKDGFKPIREVNSSLSVGLEVIINKCIKENPDDRYQTVEELLYDLNNYYKLDTSYLKSIKKKISITFGLLSFSILLMAGSFIPLKLHKNQLEDNYVELMEIAKQSGRTSDYVKAISLKPLEVSTYKGYIESMKIDGVFSKKEEDNLLNLVNPNLSIMKQEQGYGEFAYDIGKLYWYYYEGEDGDVVSNKWFQEAMNNNYKADESKLYYDLSNFKKSVSMAITESEDVGMYKKYWENLMSAKNLDSGEIIELQLYNCIADAIGVYAYRLNVDGVPKESVQSEITDIKNFITSSNPTSEKSEELYEKLKEKSVTLQSKLDAGYSKGKGGTK